jgi:hypothetical protein
MERDQRRKECTHVHILSDEALCVKLSRLPFRPLRPAGLEHQASLGLTSPAEPKKQR